MGPEEMAQIAAMIDGVLSSPDDEKTIKSVKSDVRELCMRFPLDRWWT
jgi:glycine/serine hydroxymethyltransferase